jgi:dTDP-L-rhamnose 4-epimerase
VSDLVLVTGGAGFIGSHLVDALLSRGYRVRVLDSLEPQVHGPKRAWPSCLNPEAEAIQGNVLDPGAVGRALDGVRVIVHLAARVGVGQSMYQIADYCRDNVTGTGVLLGDIVRRRGSIRRIIVASSMSLYGEGAYRRPDGSPAQPGPRSREVLERGEWEPRDAETGAPLSAIPTPESKPLAPRSVYAVTKRDQEELFLSVGAAYHIPAVALRLFNVYGTRQALGNPYTGVAAIFGARLLNHRSPVIFEDGLQTRDLVHVSDVVQSLVLAIDSDAAPGHVLNVGTGKATTILDLARRLGQALGVPAEPDVTGRFREGDIRHCVADISAARRLLSYQPRVTVEQGVPELAGWIRSQTADDRFDEARRELMVHGLA